MRINMLLLISLLASCGGEKKMDDQTADSTMLKPNVVGEEVVYMFDGDTLKGYIAYDENKKGERPGVLIVHEWWGHTQYVRDRARMLAELGYTAFALDMYGNGKTADHPNDANAFMMETFKDMPRAIGRFDAAQMLLANHKTTLKDSVSAIGYCFGGGVVLAMARMGKDLDLVASFHGSLATEHPAKAGMVKAEVMVFNGNADPMVKPEHIDAFKKEMEAAGANYSYVGFDGAVHAFTNPGATEKGKKFNMPLAYDATADSTSWAMFTARLASRYGMK